MAKPEKHEVAYAVINEPGGFWGVGACREGESGYHPVPDYGPYADEAKAEGVVARLNARLGVGEALALRIIRSTIQAQEKKERRMKAAALSARMRKVRAAPRGLPRKHSREGSVRCEICAPNRCEKAR